MSKSIEFKAGSKAEGLVSWLKRFEIIAPSVLLEVDTDSMELVAKIYNEERSVVKYSRLSFEDAGLELAKKPKIDQRIKVGIFALDRLIKSIGHFMDKEFTITVKFEEVVDGENNKELGGVSILLKNASLKVSNRCASLHIFNYIPDDKFTQGIADTNGAVPFDMTSELIDNIRSLSTLDKDYKYIKFEARDDGNIYAKSNMFEYELASGASDDSRTIELLTDQFLKVDKENYECFLGGDRIVFNSKDSGTSIVTSMVERDENYEETAPEDAF